MCITFTYVIHEVSCPDACQFSRSGRPIWRTFHTSQSRIRSAQSVHFRRGDRSSSWFPRVTRNPSDRSCSLHRKDLCHYIASWPLLALTRSFVLVAWSIAIFVVRVHAHGSTQSSWRHWEAFASTLLRFWECRRYCDSRFYYLFHCFHRDILSPRHLLFWLARKWECLAHYASLHL